MRNMITIMINMMMTLMRMTNLYHPEPLSWPGDCADDDDNDHQWYNYNCYSLSKCSATGTTPETKEETEAAGRSGDTSATTLLGERHISVLSSHHFMESV